MNGDWSVIDYGRGIKEKLNRETSRHKEIGEGVKDEKERPGKVSLIYIRDTLTGLFFYR